MTPPTDAALTRATTVVARTCRWLTGHRIDGIAGRCHLCRAQVPDPIKD